MKFTMSNLEKLRQEYQNLKNKQSEEMENLKFSLFNGNRRAIVFRLKYGISRLAYTEYYINKEEALIAHKNLSGNSIFKRKELKEVYVANLNMDDILSMN